jgi:hypothetical protein
MNNEKSLASFSHFTYHHIKEKKLECDLKGIKLNKKYILTYPCI